MAIKMGLIGASYVGKGVVTNQRTCSRCPQRVSDRNQSRKNTTGLCRDCLDIARLPGGDNQRGRNKARREGWDYDNPLANWPGDADTAAA